MKNNLSSILAIALVILITGCAEAPEADKAEVNESIQEVQKIQEETEDYEIVLNESLIYWIGTQVTGQHKGTINFQEGVLSVSNNNIVTGEFIINMKSIKVTDMKEDKNIKLADHLMNEDFFDTNNYPVATCVITNVTQTDPLKDTAVIKKQASHEITLNLTIKDSTKSITFPALIDIKGNEIYVSSNFNIDRTQWGVHYKAAQSFGDKQIYPEVNIGILLRAKKKAL